MRHGGMHRVYGLFMRWFRPRRARAFRSRFPEIDRGISILDVGGSLSWWSLLSPKGMKLTVVNLDDRHRALVEHAGHRFLVADARVLPFSDGEFDLGFSNSVIEHLGNRDDQQRFAQEMLRVARSIYCQTPNRWFPIEPHLVAPFLHWLPFRVARRLVRYASMWGLVTRPSQQQVDALLASIRLLSFREVRELFAGCEIRRERTLGLTKSFIIARRVPGGSASQARTSTSSS